MHGIRNVWPAVTWDATWRRELPKHEPQAVFVLCDLRMYFCISAFEVGHRVERRTAMPGTGNINDICVSFFDQAIQVNVDEVLSRRSSPVPKEPRLNLYSFERLSQKGVLKKIDLADAWVIWRAPVPVHLPQHS